jgi:predicted nucleotidyltransferase
MEEKDIIERLSLVGDELQNMGLKRPIRILLIGGAYMITQIHNRSVTRDVDIVAKKFDRTSEEHRLLKQAVRSVANHLNASPAWLSDNMADFIKSVSKVPGGKLWFSRGKLEVYLPDPGYILALKLISGRDKDLEDIEALLQMLNLKKHRQVENLIKKYVDQETQEEYSEEIQTALDTFFQ